jgi:hypothetical protein
LVKIYVPKIKGVTIEPKVQSDPVKVNDDYYSLILAILELKDSIERLRAVMK